jgi:hypothetical protein
LTAPSIRWHKPITGTYLAETRQWLQLPLRRQSLFALTFPFQAEHQDLLIPGAVPRGVEQHEIAARGASDPDGEGQVPVAIPAEGKIVSVGRKLALDQEHGKGLMPSDSAEPHTGQALMPSC